VQKHEAKRKGNRRSGTGFRDCCIVSKPSSPRSHDDDDPVLWSLAWSEEGELAPQDRFDLLQTLVGTESLEVQADLVAAVERLGVTDITLLSTGEVTGLCA
jgi:hypothetical protein